MPTKPIQKELKKTLYWLSVIKKNSGKKKKIPKSKKAYCQRCQVVQSIENKKCCDLPLTKLGNKTVLGKRNFERKTKYNAYAHYENRKNLDQKAFDDLAKRVRKDFKENPSNLKLPEFEIWKDFLNS